MNAGSRRIVVSIAAVGIHIALGAGAHARQATPETPSQSQAVPRLEERVSVSAEDGRRIRVAVRSLQRSEDPFLARIADRVVTLADALAHPDPPDTIFTIGPLTDREHGMIDLPASLSALERPQGPIHIQVKTTWTETAPRVYRFNPAGLVTLVAEMARGPAVQVPALQQVQTLFVGRMILDLNYQRGGVIPHKDVLQALAGAFADTRAGDRIVGIIETMADDGGDGVYDLVPPKRLDDFRKRAEPGFIVPSAEGQPETIQIRYGESLYWTRADDLIWSCLRSFAGDNSDDWMAREGARERASLGRDVLDYLDAQIRLRTIDAMWVALAAAAPDQDRPLGAYRAGGPVMAFLKGAPGVIRQTSKRAPGRVDVSVRGTKVAELRRWLERAEGNVARSLDAFR